MPSHADMSDRRNLTSETEKKWQSLFDTNDGREADSRTLPRFRDVAESPEIGLQFRRFSDIVPGRYFLPEVMGGGIGWIDVDRDGRWDLYAVNGSSLWDVETAPEYTNRLFRNNGDGFCDVTSESNTGDLHYGQGCTVGDFNADGFPDLYVTNYGRNSLLQANGDGTYCAVTEMAGVGCESWSTSAVWVDADRDHLADLYCVNYLNVTRENHRSCHYVDIEGYCGPGQWDAVGDVLYLNSGDGGFRPAASIASDLNPADSKG
ncbi:MAG: VCBS repeat-containing protein, partial [Planctomycetaceae bacterium]|nr:VCBS repeat-containing protein [Planctomycetaceae bacterium]